MKTSFVKRICTIGICVCSLLGFSTAYSAIPTNLTGIWFAAGNTTTGELEISQGATTDGYCFAITGFIFNDPIEGYYCQYSGHLVFARLGGNDVPFQVYDAVVSRDGTIDRLGGSFTVWNAAGGRLANEAVEFNFDASR